MSIQRTSHNSTHSNSNSSSARSSNSRSLFSERHGASDNRRFQEILKDFANDNAKSSSVAVDVAADGMSEVSDMSDVFAAELVEESMGLSNASDTEQAHEMRAAHQDGVLELSPSLFSQQGVELSALARTQDAASVASSPAFNQAAARIIEEMKLRAKQNESRHWQFSLPGLLGASAVTVDVERLDDQSWTVKLTSPDESADKDRLALQHRLAEHFQDVTVSMVKL